MPVIPSMPFYGMMMQPLNYLAGRSNFLLLSHRMKPYFDFLHTVIPDDIDAQGHVHNLRYLLWSLAAAGKHSAACGWDEQSALESGFGWVVRKHEITYRVAALLGDEVVVRTWVSQLDEYASLRKYVVTRPADQTVLARVETRWVYVNLQVHKVVAIPRSITESLSVCPTPPGMPWNSAK